MCANGARCAARLAHELGAAPQRMQIETVAGTLQAEAMGDRVRLRMTPPGDWRDGEALQVNGHSLAYGFVNTGVPHVVLEVENLDEVDVASLGAAIRHHPEFAPAGTNADFLTVTAPDTLRVRTYERGVEAETLACGTGIVASALIAARRDRVRPPVRVTAASGDELDVAFRLTPDGAEDVILEGPTTHVFRGTLHYHQG
jgi:diaminopimelate epimerase